MPLYFLSLTGFYSLSFHWIGFLHPDFFFLTGFILYVYSRLNVDDDGAELTLLRTSTIEIEKLVDLSRESVLQ